jgi:hypothetical protein
MPTPPADRAAGLQEDLKQVDECWERERRPLMTQDRRGRWHPPEEEPILYNIMMTAGIVLGLMSAVAGHSLHWTLAGIAGFFLFPFLIALPAIRLQERAKQRYQDYKKLEAEYQARRQAVIEIHARLR